MNIGKSLKVLLMSFKNLGREAELLSPKAAQLLQEAELEAALLANRHGVLHDALHVKARNFRLPQAKRQAIEDLILKQEGPLLNNATSIEEMMMRLMQKGRSKAESKAVGQAVRKALKQVNSPEVAEGGQALRPYPKTIAEIRDRTWFHGSETKALTEDMIRNWRSGAKNLLGPGLYMTDDPSLAASYAPLDLVDEGATASINALRIKPRALLDLGGTNQDQAVGKVKSLLHAANVPYSSQSLQRDYDIPAAMRLFADAAKTQTLPQNKSTSKETWGRLLAAMADQGYDGMLHPGGLIRGDTMHNVTVLTSPGTSVEAVAPLVSLG